MHTTSKRPGELRMSIFRRSMDREGLVSMAAVLEAAARTFTSGETFRLENIQDFRAANHALDTVWAQAVEALRGNRRAEENLVCSDDVIDLLNRVRQVGTVVKIAESKRKDQALGAVRRALSQLNELGRPSNLIPALPDAMATLGFDRSIVSRVQNSTWIPNAVAVSGDPEWAGLILRAGTDNPRHVGPHMVESEILRRRVGILVQDVARNRGKVHTELVAETETRSYVAAPLMAGSSVIGFLHADRYFQSGEVDEMDRDLLSAFAAGANFALQRAVMASRIDSLRGAVKQMTEGLWSFVDATARPVTLAKDGDPDDEFGSSMTTSVASSADVGRLLGELSPEAPLTRREIDVLRLMTSGDTNHRIASRLNISEGTVKTHVGSILRKLQAANRAEAVARWINVERDLGVDHRG